MAAAAYSAWTRAGRPVEPAQPIRDIVSRMKLAFPRASSTFGWYANEAHYTATPPEDHTPFSATGWPLPSPQWFVFATDVMHRPDLGVDCSKLFVYWLAEAKAGRMPWLKYLIWQARIYDVRNGWKPQSNTGHFDHIHISARTDYRNTGLGSWSLQPGQPGQLQEDDMYLVNVLVGDKNFEYVGQPGAWSYISTIEALAWLQSQGIKDLGTMWDWEAKDRLGLDRNTAIMDPAELEAIKQAAGDGITGAIPAIVAALVAKLPADALSRDDVEAAVREALATGFVLAPTAQ